MSEWRREFGTYLNGEEPPHYQRAFGDGRVATITYDPTTGGNITWHLDAPRQGRGLVRVASGTAHSVEDAKALAEQAHSADVHRPGRRPLGAAALSSTERNKLRIARLQASERAEANRARFFVELHRELVATGQVGIALRIARILQSTAIGAVADYTRRNAGFFVTAGPHMPTVEEKAERKGRIIALADTLDELANEVVGRTVEYGRFEAILRDLHKEGFFPNDESVSAVAQGFFLAA